MRLPGFAIENHQFSIVVVLLLVISGIVSFVTMPRSEDPQLSIPGSSVIVIYPGASTIDLERLVAGPIEEVINELEDIKMLVSHTEDGLAFVEVEFEMGSDPDEKFSDVVQKVNSIRDELPDGIMNIDLHKWSVTDVIILQLAIVSENAAYRDLENEAEELKRTLETVPGVMEIETMAYPEQEVRAAVDLDKMSRLGISLDQVMHAIRSGNANIPGGSVDIGSRKFNIRTSGDFDSIDDIRNTIVHSRNGRIVYLKDIADVRFDYADETYMARFNGERAVFVTVEQKEGTNVFSIAKRLRARIDPFRDKLPPGMRIETVFDQTVSVSRRVNGFFANFIQGVFLVGLVIVFSLGFRASAIVMLAIPFSVLIAIGLVDASGYGLQQMTIVGLVIALGLLVDNAIVVVENTSRFMRKGHGNVEAAVLGTEQVGWPIVSATVTTVLAFLPLLLNRSVSGEFIRSMPLTVIFTLLASLFISLVLTPYLSATFLRTTPRSRPGKFQRFLNVFIEKRYRRIITYALGRPKRVLALALLMFAVSLSLFPLLGFSLFPKAEKTQLMIDIDTPDGTSLDGTGHVARYVESVLTGRDEVLHYATNVGHGNPRLYYNIFPKSERTTHAQIFVQLKEIGMRDMDIFMDELRVLFDRYPGAEIKVKEFEQGPPVEAPIEIRIINDNLHVLEDVSRRIERIFETTQGTVNIDNPLGTSKVDLHVSINREKAAMLGVPIVEIDQTVRAGMAGLPVSTYHDEEGKDYDIVLRLPVGRKAAIEDFDRLRIASVTGAMIPLGQLASIEFEAGPVEINHYKLERLVRITSDVLGGYSVDRVTKEIVHGLEGIELPKGCRISVGGELESREESFGGLVEVIILALISIMAVLVFQFRSFRQPLIVFSAIPLAVIGSMFALLITRNSFSFTAFVGLTSLVGIVVNNSIILVDYTNKLMRSGADMIDALREAGETRFTPILLTTLTTIGGLLPLTVGGGELWAPMGWTIIGGLIVSTVLTLVIVPVLYRLMEGGVDVRRERT